MTSTKRNLTATICLTLAVFLGSGGVGYAQDLQKGLEAYQQGDYATAVAWFRKSAEQGVARAQFTLGLMYDNGQGVTQDYKEAAQWYRKSAEQGVARAQFTLGLMYVTGQGVLQDNVYAHMWWNIAASTGHADATKNRDIIAERMTAADISKAQELARECIQKNYKGC
jgi:TPR repeat protein